MSNYGLDIFGLFVCIGTVVEGIRWWNVFFRKASGVLLLLLALFGFRLFLFGLGVNNLLLVTHWLPASVVPISLISGLLVIVIVVIVIEERTSTTE